MSTDCRKWSMKYINSKDLDAIRGALITHTPQLISVSKQRQASVALILRDARKGTEVLFIQRATSELDPWSGQIAFPGGGKEVFDSSCLDAAIRETLEEIGVALTPQMKIGRLDDHQGRNNNRSLNLVISCFVFHIDERPELIPNYEVAEAFWVPLAYLLDPVKAFDYQTPFRSQAYPAIDLGPGEAGQSRILWGLTYRFVQNLLSILS